MIDDPFATHSANQEHCGICGDIRFGVPQPATGFGNEGQWSSLAGPGPLGSTIGPAPGMVLEGPEVNRLVANDNRLSRQIACLQHDLTTTDWDQD
jgi:hypothetical protein